ncbi:hypothetical protein BDW72DRAFT_211196 [Aspergillus terricola var. indicus]
MIPPCDPTILEHNPLFKRLHRHLTASLLNPDGSTRAIDAQPARREVMNELKGCRMRNAKKQIKKQMLRQLASDPGNELPDECRELLAIVSLYLESSPNQLDPISDPRDGADVDTLLAPDFEQFYAKLPFIMPHFTRALASALHDLQSLANAGDKAALSNTSIEGSRPRIQARYRPKAARQDPLAPQLSERLQNLRYLQLSELAGARTRMAATAAEVLAMREAVLERTVTLLERTKHGAMARAMRAKAEHLAAVAHGVEGKLRVMRLDALAAIHTPEVNAALFHYCQHLRDTRGRLEERKRLALNELKAYEDVDSSTNRGPAKLEPIVGIARQSGLLIRQIEDVKSEIQRLQSRETKMADEALSIYDEIEIEDMTFDANLQIYHYPCPCGDRFEIAIDDLRYGEEIAVCPSCSLMIKVIFDQSDLPKEEKRETEGVSVKA